MADELLNFWVGDGMDCWECLWYKGKHPIIQSLDSNEKTNAYITEKWKPLLDLYLDKNIDLMKKNDHPLENWMATSEGRTSIIILFGIFPKRIYNSETYQRNKQIFQKIAEFAATFQIFENNLKPSYQFFSDMFIPATLKLTPLPNPLPENHIQLSFNYPIREKHLYLKDIYLRNINKSN